ncbi:TPA: HAMP domain-containing protein [Pseudomonas aeruginosa]|uniref:sensor histidine kinase n=1 Tax=Pseudomonas aeruginosa TaxID=287 RepID=UPI00053ED3D9|nr:ATP-binding protein [Pseudomonas aeruginosa]EME5358238.1 HAMP domain-containing protein [Pseudomonas aeruginosa]MBX5685326.1 HAMP domain-containing protein [Pseudomonas aeruginosa]MBX5788205.1 HAMP domain-containing protein [Pseudomonas aeruginosa]MCD2756603.1 HAMP domain-containing protein [Pseudomonas aeruginosa]MCO3322733.1 HAMP domain-containing protein [Pseudomonas aeruginosa]
MITDEVSPTAHSHETLWRWISLRMISLAFIALALVGGGMWYRFALWNANLREAIPEPVRQELQILEAAPEKNQIRLRQIYGEHLYGDYFAPNVIREDMLFFVGLVLLALPLIVAGGVWVSFRLSRQLSAVALSAGEIAQGNFASRASLVAHTPPALQNLTTNFNHMAARLQCYDRELQESSAAIAHELRTPLTAAVGRLQGIMDGIFQADCKQLETIMRQLHQLSRLTDDLHLLSMAHIGKLELSQDEIAMKELCEERVAWAILPQNADHFRIHLSVSEHLKIWADRDRIGQLLSVLIDNALRYAAPGNELVLRADSADGIMTLLAEDRGPGFAREHLDRVCERFWRAETSRSRHAGGSGLGLSIASAICAAHGGDLTAINRRDGGAQIRIRIPLNIPST